MIFTLKEYTMALIIGNGTTGYNTSNSSQCEQQIFFHFWIIFIQYGHIVVLKHLKIIQSQKVVASFLIFWFLKKYTISFCV